MISNYNLPIISIPVIHWVNAKPTTVRVPSSILRLAATIVKWNANLFCFQSLLRERVKQTKHSLQNSQRHCMINRHRIRSSKALKTRWQGYPLQALLEPPAKTQALKTRWQGHPLQALVKVNRQNSSFEESVARSPAPGFGLKSSPKLKLWRLDGKVTRSRLWLKVIAKTQALQDSSGKVTRSRLWLKFKNQNSMLWRLDGKVTRSRLWLKCPAKTQALKTRWQGQPLQALVEIQ